MSKSIFIILCILSIYSCKNMQQESADNPLLAEVVNQKLHLSDITDRISTTRNKADSAAMVVALTEDWIHDQLLTSTSQKKFKSNDKIEKLVNDYRNALINFEYEEYIIATQLDSTISRHDVEVYYSQEKENFKLQTDIYLVNYAIVPDKAKGIDKFFESWNTNKLDKISSYCLQNAISYCIDTSCWMNGDEIVNMDEVNSLKRTDLIKGKKIQKHENSREYFVNILEAKKEGDIAPIAYIESDLKKVLLHKRKRNLIKEHTKKLYQDLLKENKIKNYLKLGK